MHAKLQQQQKSAKLVKKLTNGQAGSFPKDIHFIS